MLMKEIFQFEFWFCLSFPTPS